MKSGWGFWAGLGTFAFALTLPLWTSTPEPAARALAMTLLMAVWWASEALPFGAVALAPLLLAPLLGLLSAADVAKCYGDSNIFLFLGGFCLALALEKCGLHRRIALAVIRRVGSGPGHLLGGFMIATALISMWVSNTASTLMLLPVALAVIRAAEESSTSGSEAVPAVRRWGIALLLGIPYAASIGGCATLIGSPPNLILAGQLQILFPALEELTFVRYLAIALPFCLAFLALTWFFLITFVGGRSIPKRVVDPEWIRRQAASMGPWSQAEKRVRWIFAFMALGWIFRSDLDLGFWLVPGWGRLGGIGAIGDAGVSIAGALLLFIVSDGRRDEKTGAAGRLLDGAWVPKIPWDVLLLFGGGFAIAECVRVSGFAQIAGQAVAGLRDVPLAGIVGIISLSATFISEMMSNTAQASILMPVVGSAAESLQIHPYLLMIPAAFASSLAFMLPAGTPPNAIVFASGRIQIKDMIRAGFFLNLLGAAWITLYTLMLSRGFAGK